MNKGEFNSASYYAQLSQRMGGHRFIALGDYKRVGMTRHSRGISYEDAQIYNRIARVREALARSEGLAAQQLLALLGNLNLDMIMPLLTSICHDIGLYMGGSILMGGVAGGILGFMAGGVGAVPGAIAGGTLGAELGTVIMAFLGLKAVVEYMVGSLPKALDCYKEGFMAAWGPVENTCMHGNPHDICSLQARTRFAEGHVIVVLAFLAGLVAYLTRGKGDMKLVLAEIRANPRLGATMANWLAQNGERLVKHPQLQRPMQSSMHGSGPVGTGNAGSASAAPAPARTGTNTGTRQSAQNANPPLPPKPLLQQASQLLGKTQGGPGVWKNAPARTKGMEYQEQISGVTRGLEYAMPIKTGKSGEVLFDGFDAQRRVLLDAKDWQGYPPANTSFWQPGTIKEARRQIEAAGSLPIEWHFSTQESFTAVKDLFRDRRISKIKLIFTPKN